MFIVFSAIPLTNFLLLSVNTNRDAVRFSTITLLEYVLLPVMDWLPDKVFILFSTILPVAKIPALLLIANLFAVKPWVLPKIVFCAVVRASNSWSKVWPL